MKIYKLLKGVVLYTASDSHITIFDNAVHREAWVESICYGLFALGTLPSTILKEMVKNAVVPDDVEGMEFLEMVEQNFLGNPCTFYPVGEGVRVASESAGYRLVEAACTSCGHTIYTYHYYNGKEYKFYSVCEDEGQVYTQ